MVVRSDPSSSTFSITMRAVLQRVKQASVHGMYGLTDA